MDKEMLAKMLNKGYLDPDSNIAKMYIIKHHKDIIQDKNAHVKIAHLKDLKKIGITTEFQAISFHKIDFPELWEKQQQ